MDSLFWAAPKFEAFNRNEHCNPMRAFCLGYRNLKICDPILCRRQSILDKMQNSGCSFLLFSMHFQ